MRYSCGLDAAVDVVGGKWKPMILWALGTRPYRFGELRRELDGISEKVLIQQLRELQRDGIVDRTVHEQVPPKVVYSLTPLGETLDAALAPLGDWGEANLAHIVAVRERGPVSAEPRAGDARPADDDADQLIVELAAVADRLASLAESAELMGDEAAAARYRSGASTCRLRAMALLDGADPSTT